METTPSIDKAVSFFDAHTVELSLGDRRLVRCYSGRKTILTCEEAMK